VPVILGSIDDGVRGPETTGNGPSLVFPRYVSCGKGDVRPFSGSTESAERCRREKLRDREKSLTPSSYE